MPLYMVPTAAALAGLRKRPCADLLSRRRRTLQNPSVLEFRVELSWRARELFERAGEVPAALYLLTGDQFGEKRLAVSDLDALGKAAVATSVALAVGRAEAEKAALLLPVVGRDAEHALLLIAEPESVEAFVAIVQRGPRAFLGGWEESTTAVEGLFVDALAAGLAGPPCPACGVCVGEPHSAGCDVELCSFCGEQFFLCGCPEHDRSQSAWAGVWPGVFECRALGWYARRTSSGWERCDRDSPMAREDLNRLALAKEVMRLADASYEG